MSFCFTFRVSFYSFHQFNAICCEINYTHFLGNLSFQNVAKQKGLHFFQDDLMVNHACYLEIKGLSFNA